MPAVYREFFRKPIRPKPLKTVASLKDAARVVAGEEVPLHPKAMSKLALKLGLRINSLLKRIRRARKTLSR